MSNLGIAQIQELVRYYDDLIEYISKKIGNRQLAVDVVQETYLRVLQRPEQFQDLHAPLAFLRKVCFNIALDCIRKNQTYEKHLDAVDVEGCDSHSACDGFSEQELGLIKSQFGQLILAKINALPPTCRDVLILVQFYGMSQTEVALQLEMSRMMVIKHLTKGLGQLMSVFIEDENP